MASAPFHRSSPPSRPVTRKGRSRAWLARSRASSARWRSADCSKGWAMSDGAERIYTLIAELTYRCPLRCPYCSNPLDFSQQRAELDTDEWRRVFSQAEELGALQLNLTGGEPLLRDDLELLVGHARSLDLFVNLITSGLPL